MAVNADQVTALAGLAWDDAVDKLLDPAVVSRQSADQPPKPDRWQDLVLWWVKEMAGPETGIVNRLTWFWHGLLTTNTNKVGQPVLLQRQLALLRQESLGNYRTLLQQFVVDGALLRYLDGDGSEAYNPNENLGRELMELFTMGIDNYTQDDVRAAARALAGWEVETEKDTEPRVVFRREAAFVAPMIFLGEQADWTTEKVVDRLCDHPATAARISSLLWVDLVGSPLSSDQAASLGQWWQEQDLEIAPLVGRILRSDEARAARFSRPRSGLEWFSAAAAAAGFEVKDPWALEALGQLPYQPPNVGGWPKGERWLQPGSLLARGSFVYEIDLRPTVSRLNTTDQVLTACGIESVSAQTQEALDAVASEPDLDLDAKATLRWRLCLNSPEFHLL